MGEGSDIDRLVALCDEALLLYGDDWTAIGKHIRDELSRWPEEERRRLDLTVERLLPAMLEAGHVRH